MGRRHLRRETEAWAAVGPKDTIFRCTDGHRRSGLLPVPRTSYLGVLMGIGGLDGLETEIYQGVEAGSCSTRYPARCHRSTGSSGFGAESKRTPEVDARAGGRSGARLSG